MTLRLTTGKGKVTFAYTDDSMMAAFEIKSEDPEEKILATLRRVLAFVDAQEGKEQLPVHTPGVTLSGAVPAQAAPVPVMGNGWANLAQQAPPELPADRQGEWELIPPGEQG
ncbi:hypothetical protein AB0E62_00315 [Streptomyces sp. NPDC038707]|uniref:hypothetical protein n=1 Tax=Streptomyces sp. NPDC038707 TaxID=3154329 RepID=UPI0033D1A5EE